MLVFNPSVLNKVVKTMTPQKERVEEAQIRGTIVFSANEHFVRLDGASGDSLTPIANFAEGASDAGFVHGDRVLVLIKNHQAIVTKNLTTGLQAQAAKEAGSFVTVITDEGITAQRIIANDTFTNTLRANEITADEIIAGMATIDQLDANYAHITSGVIDNATIDHADVNDLDANYAHITNGVIDNAKIGYADVNNLNAHYAAIDLANVNNAWIEYGAIKKAEVFDENVFDLSGNRATISRIDASKINVANLRADNLIVRRINGQPVVGGYTLIDSTSSGYASKNPQALGWYEFVNAQWVLSTDTTVDMTKAYYQTGNEVSLYDQAYIDGLENDLQQQIDGAVETFTGTVVPTLVNWPYTDWYDTSVTPVHDERAKHVGDIYYVVNTAADENGYCYRFAYDNTQHAYSWVLIKDSDVTKALSDISELQSFESETTSWIEETDQGLETIRTNYTNLSGRVDDVEDTANAALPASTFQTFESTTFTDLVDEVDEQSTTMTNMTTRLGLNADGTQSATDIVAKESALEQTVNGISTRVGKTEIQLKGMYATSSTAAGTAAKVATIIPTLSNYELVSGAMVTVKFTANNTTASPTLNLNSTGAKPIKTYSGGNLSADEYTWKAGSTFTFTYNGTNWLMHDSTVSVRMSSAESSITQTATSIESVVANNDTYTAPDGTTKTNTIQSAIKQNADNILLRVEKSGVIAAINASVEEQGGSAVKISADKVNITGTTIFNAVNSDADAKAAMLNSEVQVGGRNILAGTVAAVSKATTSTSGYVTQSLYYTPSRKTLSDLGYVVDDEVTLSFDWKITNATTYGNARIEWYGYKDSSNQDVYLAPLINPFATFSSSNTYGHVNTTVKLTATTVNAKRLLVRIDNSNLTLTISNLKLEKGNKATTWTPAPEDVQSEIDAKKSVHTLTSWYLSTGAPYATILGYAKEGQSTTFSVNDYSSENVKIGDSVRIAYAVSDMGTEGNRPIVYINGTVTAMNDARTSITITGHGLDTTIIDGGNIITNSIGANQIASDAITADKIAANAIDTTKLTVGTQNDVLNSNIIIGGNNILRGTANIQEKSPYTWSNAAWYKSGTGTMTTGVTITDSPIPCITKAVRLTITDASKTVGPAQGGIPFKKGKITQSIWVKGTAGDKIELQPIWANASGPTPESAGSKSFTFPDGNWHKYTFTVNVAYDHPIGDDASNATNSYANGGYAYFRSSTVGNSCLICGNKIEYGTKDTDWSPAQEDGVNDNLLMDTQKMSQWMLSSHASRVTTGEFGEVTITGTTANWSGSFYSAPLMKPSILNGEPLWLSFDYTITAAANVYFNLQGTATAEGGRDNSRTRYLNKVISLPASSSWKRFYVQMPSTLAELTNGSGDVNGLFMAFFLYVDNVTLKFRKMKLEHGLVPTEWTPSPEDFKTYVTRIDDNGIRIHPASTANNSVVINASGMEVFKGGTGSANSVAFYGDTARVGASSASRIEISPNGLDVYGKNDYGAWKCAEIGVANGTSTSGSTYNPYYTFGYRNGTKGNFSMTVGATPTASGYSSFAQGESTASGSKAASVNVATASGYSSFAGGTGTASADYSVCFGDGTQANGNSQMAIGKYNVADTTSLFIIGNGYAGARSNALAVSSGGELNTASAHKVGGYKLITTGSVSKAGSAISGGSYGEVTVSATKTGYTPIGIIGYTITGTNVQNIVPYQMYLNGTTATAKLRNVGSNSYTPTVTFYVLYIASGQGI